MSGLGRRPKANSRRGDVDYVTYTVRRALQQQKKVWQPSRAGNEHKAGEKVSMRSRGRPKCQVDRQKVFALRVAGKSLRQIARECSVLKTTIERLLKAPIEKNGQSSAPKVSQKCQMGHSFSANERNGQSTETGMSWAAWKAHTLNRLFLELGTSGELGRITVATIEHGEQRYQPASSAVEREDNGVAQKDLDRGIDGDQTFSVDCLRASEQPMSRVETLE